MNRTRRICAFAIVALAAIAALPHGAAGGRVVTLDRFGGLAGLFNLAQGTVRIVSVLSPTCDECRRELEDITAVVAEFPTRRLRAYITFVPQHEEDTVLRALARVREFQDRRVVYLWDPDGVTVGAWSDTAAGAEESSHLHALYDTGARFREKPDKPDWLHAHTDTGGPLLNRKELTEMVRGMLDRLESRLRPKAGE